MRRLFCCLSVVYDRVWRRKVEMAYEELSRATRTFDKAQTSSLTSLPSRCPSPPKSAGYFQSPIRAIVAHWRRRPVKPPPLAAQLEDGQLGEPRERLCDIDRRFVHVSECAAF
jgi:hypothetical protein